MRTLRDWLIMTTSTDTFDTAMGHFRARLGDPQLLADLVEIALEGEDMGDAPWAAANVITEFPVALLRLHELQLQQIAAEQWDYLNRPAKEALEKIASSRES